MESLILVGKSQRVRRCKEYFVSSIAVGCISLFLTLWANPASSSQVEPLTLSTAIERAVQHNPSLASMQARYQAMSNMPSQAGALPDPMLMLNAMNIPTDTFNTNQEGMTQMQIGVAQSFPFPGKRKLKEEMKSYEATAASHSVSELKSKIAKDVKQKWLDLFYLDKAIEVTRKNQDLMRKLIETARKKYEVGKGLQQDVLLAQLELSKLLDHAIMLDTMREHQQIKLNILMDSPVDTPIVLEHALPTLALDEIDADKAQDDAMLLRSALSEKEQQLKAAEAGLDLAKKGYYPDFKLSVLYGNRRDTPAGAKRADMMSVMLSASLPIYAGSKQSKAVKQKKEELEKSKFSLKGEQNKVRMEVAMALADLHQAQAQYSLLDEGILPQARQTVASMLSAYQVSKVDFLNLVRSQIALFNYELQYWQAKIETHKAAADLANAIGKE